jgi:ATP-dependent exoDNAse (exonuclease V) beta subunit
MSQVSPTSPPDHEIRQAAVRERVRNVFLDAGAGTGKTTILVDRLVELVVPSTLAPPVPIDRVAAITFTRKAAGELRLRIRERLLENLAVSKPGTVRESHLREALSGLDTAYVGTIHSFADRLLRLQAVEAELSPSFEIVEDEDALISETTQKLLHAVQSETLEAELEGTAAAARAGESIQIVQEALESGLRAVSRQGQWAASHGLDALVAGFIRQRDVVPADSPAKPFDASAFRSAVDDFLRLAAGVQGGSIGADWILQMKDVLVSVGDSPKPGAVFGKLLRQFERIPREPITRRHTFAGDTDAWEVWKSFVDGRNRPRPLRDDLRSPADRWMATRLVRVFPVVIALYETVKRRHCQLDQLDLLLRLRELLKKNLRVRGEFQQMFDHILVDEFQDTDPLQAEIILFLCEREPRAAKWQDVVLANAKLTLVGDPEQSIYRFRRADIAMYERVRDVVSRHKPFEAALSANFRSAPSLIDWINNTFERVLGTSDDNIAFDSVTGRVFHRPLLKGRDGTKNATVHALPFDFADSDNHSADEYRELEARVITRYLRWLVEVQSPEVQIPDPLDGHRRGVQYSDIAILAVSTSQLPLLFSRLDAEGIPYASRGGALFLEDPAHRHFILGLRAVATRDDGVAEAALLRPPFFALDLADLLSVRGKFTEGFSPGKESLARARQALQLVHDLRKHRFDRSPGATARDLLERTAFGRSVALGPNGTQRLARLRELCHLLELIAARDGLDFDGATAKLREWIDEPIQLDPPHPVETEAIEVLTVHQAKGLEFPVVVMWDGKASWSSLHDSGAWRVERDGGGWVMHLDGLDWEEPPGLGIRETAKGYTEAERRRIAYVAVTRARDLLIVPKAGNVQPGKCICGDLLSDSPPHLTRELDPYVVGREPAWAAQQPSKRRRAPAGGESTQLQVAEWWLAAGREAARSRFRPVSVTGEARAGIERKEVEREVDGAIPKTREGRFGGIFGNVVHHALAQLLGCPGLALAAAVERAASLDGLAEHVDEAMADVQRALNALEKMGIKPGQDGNIYLEYAVAGRWGEGEIISGYIDLISVAENCIDVIDFKTDLPPSGNVESAFPEYVAQIRAYGRLLSAAGMTGNRMLRCGLLFTADGSVNWVPAEA